MSDKSFIDTNIWVYAHLQETNNSKCNAALELLETLPFLASSTQVLNEYYSVMLKLTMSFRTIPKLLLQSQTFGLFK